MEFVYEHPSDEQISPATIDSGDLSLPVSQADEPQSRPPENQAEPYQTIYPRIHEDSLPSPPLYNSLDSTSEIVGCRSRTPEPPASSGSEWIRNDNIWQPRSTQNNTPRNDQDETVEEEPRGSLSDSLSLSPQISSTVSGKRHWPLEDENEALLLRHFVAKLSLWVS